MSISLLASQLSFSLPLLWLLDIWRGLVVIVRHVQSSAACEEKHNFECINVLAKGNWFSHLRSNGIKWVQASVSKSGRYSDRWHIQVDIYLNVSVTFKTCLEDITMQIVNWHINFKLSGCRNGFLQIMSNIIWLEHTWLIWWKPMYDAYCAEFAPSVQSKCRWCSLCRSWLAVLKLVTILLDRIRL